MKINEKQDFIFNAQQMVVDYSNSINKDQIILINTHIVWSCKTLQNQKALISTDIPDGRYYEVTYNGDKNEFYFDAYVKEHNELIR